MAPPPGPLRRRQLIAIFTVFLLAIYVNNLNQRLSTFVPKENDGVNVSSLSIHAGNDSSKGDHTAPQAKATLVHTDPHFIGGFRNQHMRFVAFVNYAVSHNISQILLPSLRWGDAYTHMSTLHENLFDVKFWNVHAHSKGLPRLVRYDLSILEGVEKLSLEAPPCWNVTSGLYNGLDEKMLRDPNTNLRRIDTLGLIGSPDHGEMFSHCKGILPDAPDSEMNMINNTTTRKYTHLIPFGGGTGAGHLWNQYNQMQSARKSSFDTIKRGNQTVEIYPEHVSVEKAIFQLLQPSQVLRDAMEASLIGSFEKARRNSTIHPLNSSNNDIEVTKGDAYPRLLALHPRVEQEMLRHRCARFMENNLTRVFDRLSTYPAFQANDATGIQFSFDAIFVAISRYQIEKPPGENIRPPLLDIIKENAQTLEQARNNGLFNHSRAGGIPMFESGKGTAEKVRFPSVRSFGYDVNSTNFKTADELGVAELVASIINFFTAVKADIFVGVRGSSYSTDVFSVRYYMQQNLKENSRNSSLSGNYLLGPDGIEEVVGSPRPHSCGK